MKTSEQGLALIRRFEGLRLTAYRCSAGVWTIGYGHTGTVDGKKIGKRMKITYAKAMALLKQDVKRFEERVNDRRYVPFEPTQHQFDALVSFAFNLGEGCLKQLCRAPRTPGQIAAIMTQYNHVGGVVNAGLSARRQAEQAWFRQGTADVCPYPVPVRTITSSANAKTMGCSSFICRGEQVRWVQWELNRVDKAALTVDGICGRKTEAAIRSFQRRKNLTVDGLCGKLTKNALMAG